jgi:hypothetical protein
MYHDCAPVWSPLIRVAFALAMCSACTERRTDSDATSDTLPVHDSLAAANAPAIAWRIRQLEHAPARFRPGGWSDQHLLWGILGGQPARLDVESGAIRTVPVNAWSLHTAQNVASWRNESGTWLLRGDGAPVRIAGPEPDSATGFDGPPTILWSDDGARALLGWHGEGGSRYEVLEQNGDRSRVAIRIAGYSGDTPALWLDATHVLFTTVANGPLAGEPMHRESGWRGDFAVLDLAARAYSLVTHVPDGTFLRVAGHHQTAVLVTEWDSSGVRAHWLYDPRTWQRRPTTLPKGRAFAARAGAVVVLVDSPGDSSSAGLVIGRYTLQLGRVARDTEPVFTPRGDRGSVRTGKGVLLFEAVR